MLRVTGLSLPLSYTAEDLRRCAADRLGVSLNKIASLTLRKRSVDARNKNDVHFTATVDVTNAGDMAGAEVVQVYMHDLAASVLRPVKQLIAFTRVELAPGETKAVTIQLKAMDFSLINREEKRVVEPGEFDLYVGHSSKTTDLLKTTISIDENELSHAGWYDRCSLPVQDDGFSLTREMIRVFGEGKEPR